MGRGIYKVIDKTLFLEVLPNQDTSQNSLKMVRQLPRHDSLLLQLLILDHIGRPVVGGTVQLLSNDKSLGGANTDINGKARLATPSELGVTHIKMSYTGYKPSVLPMPKSGNCTMEFRFSGVFDFTNGFFKIMQPTHYAYSIKHWDKQKLELLDGDRQITLQRYGGKK